MSEPRSLPPRPDLRRLRDEAKRRRKAGEFSSIALAQLAIAREYGFRSWPRLKFHVEAVTLDAAQRATALIASLTSEDLRRARALLDADPSLARHDLACACACGEIDEVVRRLRVAPGIANAPAGPNDWQPILYACFSRLLRADLDRASGIREVVRVLLDAGADPNASFIHHGEWLQVALYGAAGIAGDPELTRMLLEAGADPTDEREGLHGNEVLYHAVEHVDPTCAMLVIDAGARRDLVDYAVGRALNFPNAEMIEMLCAHGAKPWAAHLHQAVWRRRGVRTVTALLDAGAPIDEPDEHGFTALQIALIWGDTGTVTLLRERGASGEPVERDRLPLDQMLETAVQGGHVQAVQALLDAGARLDGSGEQFGVPLGQACWRGRVEIARELVARGARLTWTDGSAVGAALHGSRHCQQPEGGPTMQTIEEIDPAPYAAIIRMLFAAGAPVPERFGEGGARPEMLLAELGVDVPS